MYTGWFQMVQLEFSMLSLQDQFRMCGSVSEVCYVHGHLLLKASQFMWEDLWQVCPIELADTHLTFSRCCDFCVQITAVLLSACSGHHVKHVPFDGNTAECGRPFPILNHGMCRVISQNLALLLWVHRCCSQIAHGEILSPCRSNCHINKRVRDVTKHCFLPFMMQMVH